MAVAKAGTGINRADIELIAKNVFKNATIEVRDDPNTFGLIIGVGKAVGRHKFVAKECIDDLVLERWGYADLENFLINIKEKIAFKIGMSVLESPEENFGHSIIQPVMTLPGQIGFPEPPSYILCKEPPPQPSDPAFGSW